MSLGIDVLSTNKKVFNPDPNLMRANQGIWDLTNASLSFKNVGVQIKRLYYYTEDDQMRPDLVAFYNYGNQNSMGSLLKFNGYSNPFAIDTGQMLYIPTDRTIKDAFEQKKKEDKGGNTNTSPASAFKKNQEQKISKPSGGRQKYIDSKIKNQPSQILPPNMMQPGESSVIRKDGKIVFAPNAGGGGSNRPTNL
jgi:hypothetical protein